MRRMRGELYVESGSGGFVAELELSDSCCVVETRRDGNHGVMSLAVEKCRLASDRRSETCDGKAKLMMVRTVSGVGTSVSPRAIDRDVDSQGKGPVDSDRGGVELHRISRRRADSRIFELSIVDSISE